MRALEATYSINSSTLSIFSLSLLRYALVDSSSTRVILKNSIKLLFVGMLVMNHITSLVPWSLKLDMEFGSKLLYNACIDPLKVMRKILHIV